jgi:RHS repeat-associated protein
LLERIETSVDNDIFRTYFLEYEQSEFIEERTLLTSVQECPDNDADRSNCRLPTTFQWQRPALSTSTMEEVCEEEPGMEDFCRDVPTSTNYTPFPDDFTLTTSAPSYDTTQVTDINGDGFSDLVFVQSGQWRVRFGPYFTNNTFLSNIGTSNDEYALNIDSDGDGVREVLIADNETSNWRTLSYVKSTVPGPLCATGMPCASYTVQNSKLVRNLWATATGLEGEAQVMDVDGDGDEDIVFRNYNQIKAHINNGSGNFATTKILYNFTNTPDITVLNDDYQTQTADMKSASQIDINGDGRSDLIMKVTTTTGGCYLNGNLIPGGVTSEECQDDLGGVWDASTSTNNKIFISQEADGIGMDDPELVEVISLSASYDNIRVADFNGDGLSDIAYVVSNTWYYRLSDGTTLLPQREMGLVTTSSLKYHNQFIDLNGDGRADVLHATSNNNWHVYFSRPTEDAQWLVFEDRGTRAFDANAVVRFGDVSGDGRVELLTSTGSKWKKHYDANRVDIKEYTINAITTGYGVQTSIDYAPMTDSSVYVTQASDGDLGSEVFSPVSGGQLVKEVTTQTGLVSEVSVQYQYGGLLIHKQGRGNLGFQMLRTIDMQTNVVSETRYNQSYADTANGFAKAHMPVYSEQRLNGELMSSATNVLEVQPTAQGGIFPFIKTSTEHSYVLGTDMQSTHINTTVTENEYDPWGNLTDSDILMTDVATSHTISTITANDFGNADEQEKGRLRSTTVSKQRTGDASPTLRETEFNYYPNGMLEYSTYAPNVTERQLKTTNFYDGYGNKTQVTVEGYASSGQPNQQRISKTQYGTRGRYVNYTENTLGEQVNYRYNGVIASNVTGVLNKVKTISANNLQTTTFYTPFQEVRKIDYPDARNKQITRSFCSGCVTGSYIKVRETENGSPHKEVFLDKWGRTVQSQVKGFNGDWWYTRTTYDEQSRPVRAYEPNSSSEYTLTEYDDIGRAYKVTKPNNGAVEIFFDGLETRTHDERGYDSYHYSNGFGETASTKDHLNGTVTFTYNAFGSLTDTLTAADNKSSAISNDYDAWGYKTQMTDPIKGQWGYVYNAFGELIEQTNAIGDVTLLYYDRLGRKIKSFEASEGTLCWTFGVSTEASIKAVGKLKSKAKYSGQNVACTTSNTPTIKHEYTYDSLGRPFEHKTIIGGAAPYVQSQTYDSYSRPNITTYPTGTASVGAYSNYNGNGYLKEVRRVGDSYLFKSILEMDTRGNVTKTSAANGVITEHTYSDDMGWLSNITVSKGSDLYSLDVGQDLRGNVQTRHSQYASPSSNPNDAKDYMETYHYDALNRLEQRDVTLTTGILPSNLSGQQLWTYDGFGNIKTRKNVHSNTTHYYQYANDNVYRLAGVYNNASYTGTPSFKFHSGSINSANYSAHYDDNGNITSDNTRSLVYSSFDKPTSITKGNASSTMSYGVDRELYYKDDTVIENGQTVRYQRYYIGSYEKVIRTGGQGNMTEHKYNIAGAVVTYHNGSRVTSFVHLDNQGSVIMTTNYLGVVQTQALYEPFGTQSVVYEVPLYGNYTYAPITDKGYTGHKQMDHVGIIHMNGRIYDPTLGRFLHADPFIQAPKNSQSFNRYSYVLNNPMSYTDPSGYFFKSLTKFVKKHWRTIASIVIAVYLPGASFMAGYSSTAAGAITGFASGAVATGSLKGALVGAFTGGMFGELHNMAAGFDKVLAHGAVGGIGSVLGGGKFGHGFFSAGFTQAAGNIKGMFVEGAKSFSDRLSNAVKASIIGGTSSRLTGGKFSNGAITGAFSRLLNDDALFKYESLDDKDVLEFDNPKLEISLEAGPHKLLGADTDGNISGPEMGLGKTSLSEKGFSDVEVTKLGPLSVKVNENGVAVAAKYCTHGSAGGACTAVSTNVDSEYGRAVVRNVQIATTPQQTTVSGRIRMWWRENIGAPQSALGNN